MYYILHAGCGMSPLPEEFQPCTELRFDIDDNSNPDVKGTITEPLPFETGEFDAIYASHIIEHIYKHQIIHALNEFRRVLKPGGHLYLLTPDLQGLGRFIESGDTESPLWESPAGPVRTTDLLYGFAPLIAEGYEFMAHKYLFTARTLDAALRGTGFSSRLIGRRKESIELVAIASHMEFAPCI